MGGIFGGGGQTPPATYSQGGNPAAYVPQNQPGADAAYQSILGNLISAGAGPAGSFYPYASQAAMQNIDTASNPYFAQAQSGVGDVANWGGNLGQQLGQYGIDYLPQVTQNPYYADAIAAAQQAAQTGGTLGSQIAGFAPTLLPAGQNIFAGDTAAGQNIYNTLLPAGQQVFDTLSGAGQQVWNTANDPQQALYNQLVNQQQQQSNAQNAMSGLAGSPYAANLNNQALQNLAINWQNQQLGRQAQGLQGLVTGLGTGAQTLANTYNSGLQGLLSGNQQGLAGLTGAASNALNLGQGGVNFEVGTAQLPAQLYGQNLSQILSQLSGIGGIGQAGAGLEGSAALGPYNLSSGAANSTLQSLAQAIGLGNQQYTLPQQALNDLQSYLNLGQSASGLAGQLGTQGFNQNQTGLSNIVGAAGLGSNLLFGSQGLSGALGFGDSGLIGGLGGGSGLLDTLPDTFSTGADLGGLIPAAAGAGKLFGA